MNQIEILLSALKLYNINIISIDGSKIKVQNDFEIEAETNGMYKLFDDGFVVAPFDDVDELCKFILQ